MLLTLLFLFQQIFGHLDSLISAVIVSFHISNYYGVAVEKPRQRMATICCDSIMISKFA